MARVFKLSIPQLKRLIAEEKSKMAGMKDVKSVKASEVAADEFADTLEKDVDHYKGLKEAERKLTKKLEEIRKRRISVAKKIQESKGK